jgi:hypothetical protein
VLEEVRGGNIECRAAKLKALISSGCRQVGLATAAGTSQHQPPLGFTGKCPGGFTGDGKPLLVSRVTTSPLRYKVIKGEPGKSAEVAVPLQAGAAVFIQLLPGAAAGDYLAVVRLPRC